MPWVEIPLSTCLFKKQTLTNHKVTSVTGRAFTNSHIQIRRAVGGKQYTSTARAKMLLRPIGTKSGYTFDWRAIQKSTFSTNRSEKLNETNSMGPCGCLHDFNFDPIQWQALPLESKRGTDIEVKLVKISEPSRTRTTDPAPHQYRSRSVHFSSTGISETQYLFRPPNL